MSAAMDGLKSNTSTLIPTLCALEVSRSGAGLAPVCTTRRSNPCATSSCRQRQSAKRRDDEEYLQEGAAGQVADETGMGSGAHSGENSPHVCVTASAQSSSCSPTDVLSTDCVRAICSFVSVLLSSCLSVRPPPAPALSCPRPADERMETELIESKSSREVIPAVRSWPDAPDLQLDCLLTDGDEDETESEVDDEIGEEDSLNDLSDDSSVEVVGVTSATAATGPDGSSAVAADCKPGTSRLISQQPATDPLSDKCPDFIPAAPAARDPLPGQSVPTAASAASGKSAPSGRAGHLVIDLTHSDDESALTSRRNNQHNSQQNNNNHRHSIGHHHHHYHHHNSQHNPNGRPVHAAAAGQLSRRRTHSQRPIDAGAGSGRMSCQQENAGHGPVNLTHHQRHSDNQSHHSASSSGACRFLTAQHVHHAPHPGHFPEPGSSNNSGGPACSSFSNCFVATASSGAGAPSSGPCPHAHSFCPQVTSPQVYFPNAGAPGPAPSSSSYHLLPPPPILHTAPHPAGHLFPSFYGPPPAAHSQVPYQTFQINPQQPRMHPVHQQRLLEQQRSMEMQRQAYAQHADGMIRRYVSTPLVHVPLLMFFLMTEVRRSRPLLTGCRWRRRLLPQSHIPAWHTCSAR